MRRPYNEALNRARHFTLANVVVEKDLAFAFAVCDDGSEVYVPRYVVEHYGLSPEDVGVGFRALLRNPEPGSGRLPAVILPLLIDEPS